MIPSIQATLLSIFLIFWRISRIAEMPQPPIVHQAEEITLGSID